jgi:hypothetical protein
MPVVRRQMSDLGKPSQGQKAVLVLVIDWVGDSFTSTKDMGKDQY